MTAVDFGLKTSSHDEDWILSHAYWIAILSNGEVIYGDDTSPSLEEERSEWIKLKRYLTHNKLRIKKVTFKFRSNSVDFDIPLSVNWIYLSKGVGKEWTTEQEDTFFILGIQTTPTMIDRFWYKVPELLHHRTTADEISSLKPEFLHFMQSV
jgi:hypothetical protein